LPYGPGLVELGIDPDAVTLLALPDGKALLRAALDCVRDGAAAAVLLELHGRQPLLDLTATRRLALAGAENETMVLLARSAAPPTPSAVHTRWQVAAAPSQPLAANAPGFPAFALTLLRRRGGREGLSITLEWNRDTVSFREQPPLPGAVPALAPGRAAGP
jgi:protein ImuA